MYKINENYLKLPGSYLFSNIGKKVTEYKAANPDKDVISLGIGDVTQPLAPAVIEALHSAVDEMADAATFHGYAPDLGYEFLRSAIRDNDYRERGVDIALDEIFISDGAKSDSGNIGDIFAVDNKIAVCDPVYPVYVDTNAMAGRTGDYIADEERWSNVIYMPCTKETNFAPELPKETPDIIYHCFPNNPTGSTITKDQLQEWVDYANKVGAVIIYDAAYEAYISEENVPHTIYECDGAKTCAIELRSFSKNAGFTGTRLGFTVIPKELKSNGVMLNSLWARRHGTKFNGAPYIIQRAGEAVYSEAGRECEESSGYSWRSNRHRLGQPDPVIRYAAVYHGKRSQNQCGDRKRRRSHGRRYRSVYQRIFKMDHISCISRGKIGGITTVYFYLICKYIVASCTRAEAGLRCL